MHSNKYTLIFTSVLTIILASLLSIAAGSLDQIQKLNVEIDSKKNILTSLGFKESHDEKWTTNDILELFKNNIESYVLDKDGNQIEINIKSIDPENDYDNMPIYINKTENEINGYAIPISGKGLWSTLYGYFAIEPDGMTAKGITFYAHKETPGLGGEVDKLWFQNNFVGKRFIDDKGNLVGIKVVKGKADANSDYEVDGISGATITSKGLETFLVDDLRKYESFFRKIRNTKG